MPEIEKISIALTSGQITSMKAAVNSGEYATTSEIIREALRDWQWKRDMRLQELNRLRELWDAGKASGKAMPLDSQRTRAEARAALKKAVRRPA